MIIDYELRNGKPVIHHWIRKNGARVHNIINDFRPYFYVKTEEMKKHHLIIEQNGGFTSIFNESLSKIYVKKPADVKELRNSFIKTFEADILFNVRYLIDEKPDFGELPKLLFTDIEVVTKNNEFPEPDVARYPVTSITLGSNYSENLITIVVSGFSKKREQLYNSTKKWTIYECANEFELFNKFKLLFLAADPDYLSGWNSDFFDYPYLINRMKNLGLDSSFMSPLGVCFLPEAKKSEKREDLLPVIKGRGFFDLLLPYKKKHVSEIESYSLGNVAMTELGIDKLRFKGTFQDFFLADFERFLEYNARDIELCIMLDAKLRIFEYFFDLAKFIGCRIADTFSNSRMGDVYILSYCKHELKKQLPTKSFSIAETFQGATVLEPVQGLYKNVAVLDLKRIYPSIIISCNLSPETCDPNGVINIGNGVRLKEEKGFTPIILERLFKIRDERNAKKKLFDYNSTEWENARREEQFVKDLINSFYGLLSYAGFRLYAPELGSSITFMGRKILEHCKRVIEEEGYEVIYGDTDSIFIKTARVSLSSTIEVAQHLQNKINVSFEDFAKQHGIKQHYFFIEFEKLYNSLLLIGKKHYAGRVVYYDKKQVDKYDFRGIESNRSDSSKFVKALVKELVINVLDGFSHSDFRNWIKEKIIKMKSMNLADIGIPKGMHKKIDTYETVSAHVRGCVYSNQYLRTNFDRGSKAMLLYIKKMPAQFPATDVLCFEDETQLPEGIIIDYERMCNQLIAGKVERIANALGWKYEFTNPEQDTLLKFCEVKI